MVYQWTKKLHYCLFPATCLLCGAAGERDRDLCAGCRNELPINGSPCERCAMPLTDGNSLLCGQCQQQPPAFDFAYAPLLYQAPLDFLIKELKFQGRLAVALLLGDWLADRLQDRNYPLPDYIIPVPLHLDRLRERGFNQALELARPLSRRWHIPLLFDSVQRIRPTAPQSQLDPQTRRTNVKGAFIVNRSIHARHVAIVDDVITTGSTVSEIARVLRRTGVERIEVWACARALGHV